jgi:hypothetical protein
MQLTPAQLTEVARRARCGRSTARDYISGARRTSPAIAAAIDAALRDVLSEPRPAVELIFASAAAPSPKDAA